MRIVVVDPGHGGTTTVGESSPNNATGPQGTLEKNLTLEIGQLVASRLISRGQTVYLTRSADVNLGLIDRAHVARDNQADVFVSIHFNGDENPNTQGTETYHHTNGSPDSMLLAASVQQRVLVVTGYNNRGIKNNVYKVLNPSEHFFTTAACLVEISFLTNPSGEIRLMNLDYKNRLSEGIVLGIVDYLNLRSGG